MARLQLRTRSLEQVWADQIFVRTLLDQQVHETLNSRFFLSKTQPDVEFRAIEWVVSILWSLEWSAHVIQRPKMAVLFNEKSSHWKVFSEKRCWNELNSIFQFLSMQETLPFCFQRSSIHLADRKFQYEGMEFPFERHTWTALWYSVWKSSALNKRSNWQPRLPL